MNTIEATALQELNAMIDAAQAKADALVEKLDALEKKITDREKRVAPYARKRKLFSAARRSAQPKNTMTTTTAQFTAGQKVSTRSACDYDCIFTATVIRRTAKQVTLDLGGKVASVKIYADDRDGSEFCFPMGRYSMAPIFRA